MKALLILGTKFKYSTVREWKDQLTIMNRQILATDIQKTMSLLQHTANYVFSHGTLAFHVNWL